MYSRVLETPRAGEWIGTVDEPQRHGTIESITNIVHYGSCVGSAALALCACRSTLLELSLESTQDVANGQLAFAR
ncbi:hypothetical protein AZE42_10505 [Rhizopogon vesiculosus]|uniref:Uncharacterized protein n=1 Tax=Rhizopogon vesiculosus TaxID=180088 RepID=A0A1J8QQT9_9AGAM|nr:hypothetical protein AZE42_10505 [Rhizopogon vesiculosus]